MKTNRIGAVFTLLLLVLLGACGAGGGGGGGDGGAVAPHWGTPQLIEAEDLGDVDSPVLVVDSTGAVTAAWQQSDGTYTHVWANRYSGGSWGSAQKIESEEAQAAWGPAAVVDAAGIVTAVWQQTDGTRATLWANRYSGGLWSTGESIEPQQYDNSDNPLVAVDGTGNVTVVWSKFFSGLRRDMWSNRYSDGAWGDAALIETEVEGSADLPVMVMDSAGNVTAAWRQNTGTRTYSWANRFSAESWGTAGNIELENLGSSDWPVLVVDGLGNVTAAWDQFDGSRFNMWTNRYTSGWTGAVQISDETYGTGQSPALVVDGSGNVTFAWTQSDGAKSSVWASRYSDGEWSTAATIESDNDTDAQYPILGVDGTGNVTAVWYSGTETESHVWANRFSGGAWGVAQRISPDLAGYAAPIAVKVDNAGDVTVLLIVSTMPDVYLYVSRYSGGAWSAAHQLAADSLGMFAEGALVTDNAGKMTAAWTQSDGTWRNLWAIRFE